jgi:hypothetical protein
MTLNEGELMIDIFDLENKDEQEELQKELIANKLAQEAVIRARQLLSMAMDVINVDRTKHGKPIFLRIAMVVNVDQPENYKQIN